MFAPRSTLVPLSFLSHSLVASTLSLTDVRHLVVEDMMMKQKQGKTFIPNSLHMDCFLFLSFSFSS